MNAWIFYGTVVPGSAAMFLAADMCRDWWKTRRQRRHTHRVTEMRITVRDSAQRPEFTADELDALREIARLDAEAAQQ